jgi:adenosyl cobinamide kinase/adenosyl cobinamide phosphate guanylyltransferase
MITLVLGGSRSGKSDIAEQLATRAGGPVTYLATGWADDDDMGARIEAHQARRPAHWSTIEVGIGLAEALRTTSGTVLVDALGTWVAGHQDFAVDVDDLRAALASHVGDVIVVSDEVGMGVHPPTEVGRRFRDALGLANRTVAEDCDRVLLVVAGRVLALEPFE